MYSWCILSQHSTVCSAVVSAARLGSPGGVIAALNPAGLLQARCSCRRALESPWMLENSTQPHHAAAGTRVTSLCTGATTAGGRRTSRTRRCRRCRGKRWALGSATHPQLKSLLSVASPALVHLLKLPVSYKAAGTMLTTSMNPIPAAHQRIAPMHVLLSD